MKRWIASFKRIVSKKIKFFDSWFWIWKNLYFVAIKLNIYHLHFSIFLSRNCKTAFCWIIVNCKTTVCWIIVHDNNNSMSSRPFYISLLFYYFNNISRECMYWSICCLWNVFLHLFTCISCIVTLWKKYISQP